MSNDTFLYSTPKPEKPLYGQCPPKGNLLMASYSIPVFWFMLFDKKKSVVSGPAPGEGAKPYLHMTTKTREGLARAKKRWKKCLPVFGKQLATLFQTWSNFIADKASTYIHCETAEWYWMFDNDQKFKDELQTCLSAFEHVPRWSEGRLEMNRWWDKLLGQAHAAVDVGPLRFSALQTLGNLSFCGYSFHYEVPWSEDGDVVCGVMSDKVHQSVVYGKTPEDLKRYMIEVFGPTYAYRAAKCRKCGKDRFKLAFSPGHGAQRTCTGCAHVHFIVGSEQFWYEAKPQNWKCKKCRNVEANLGCGFELDYAERMLTYVHVGARCTKCGRLQRVVGWEGCDGGKSWFRLA